MREQLGPPLFPLYRHERDPRDGSEYFHFLTYGSTKYPNGDGSSYLLPFYFESNKTEPRVNELMLFPLGFFHRSSDDVSYNFSLPLFYDFRTPKSSFQMVLTLWWHYGNLETKEHRHHFLFPLGRYRSSGATEERRSTGFRFGVYRLAELFETYRSKHESSTRFLNFLNFDDEAKSGLSIFKSYERRGETPIAERSVHLFPFYFSGESAEGSHFMLFPFYGHHFPVGRKNVFLPFALSWFGWSQGGGRDMTLLGGLYHRNYGPGRYSAGSLPFYSYSWTPDVRTWGIGPFDVLYKNELYRETGKTAHSFLFPLGRYDVEPDERSGHVRILPFFFDSYNEKRRYRLSPLFFNYQQRSGKEVTWSFNYGLPTYFGWGKPNDYFGTGFPLFWQLRSGQRGWDLFAPLYFSFFSSASYGVHVLPLVSYNSYPSETQFLLFGPLFIHRRFYDYEDKNEGSSTNLLWPLTAFESRPEKYHYRLLPFFWTSRDRDERDLLLFPFWYRQWGGTRSQDYFFPLYGSYKSESIDRDFYALGTYIQTRQKDESGEVFRRRNDFLWSLFSHQKNEQSDETHVHALPFGYWSTRSPIEDRTVLGPLYYGHRTVHEGKSHYLDLLLGNIWFSKTVVDNQATIEPEAATATIDAPSESSEPSAGSVAPFPAEGVEAARKQEVVSYERGVLWPFFRWGYDKTLGHSEWLAPLYFHRKTEDSDTLALFPFFYKDDMNDRYRASYFRYFFLFDYESYIRGTRFTFGQLLFDWKRDALANSTRWRLLYPLIENEWNDEGYRYQVTPLLRGSFRESGGERTSSHSLFPLYWLGSNAKQNEGGEYAAENEHFYLFPFYGINKQQLRTQHDALMPFLHVESGLNLFRMQIRPFFFFRRDPEQTSFRLWPLLASEYGETAGDWWVSKYLFMAKHSVKSNGWSFRLDPFLFRANGSRDGAGAGGLFELMAYDRRGPEKSFRLLPLTYFYAHEKTAGSAVVPLFYTSDYGDAPTPGYAYWLPWRFFFLVNNLRGRNSEYTTVLTLLSEYESSPTRPDYSDFRFLFRLFQNTRTETSHTVALYPFFYYSRDDASLSKTFFSLLPALYRYDERAGQGHHYILWGIPIY